MNKLDFDAINQAIDARSAVEAWAPGGKWRGDEYSPPNPTRNDKNPGSFVINIKKGVWIDYATKESGSDLVSLYAYIFHQDDQGAAAKELAENFGVRIGDPVVRQQAAERAKVANIEEARPEPVFPVPIDAPAPSFVFPDRTYGAPVHTWVYRDRAGRVLLYVCRFDPPNTRKQIIPRAYCRNPKKDGATEWMWRGVTGKAKRPLYQLDRLGQDPEADAHVCEGEKTADAAQRLFPDAIATTWLGGSATAEFANVKALEGRRVILWPDFDSQREPLTKDEANEGVDAATKPFLPLHDQPGIRAMMTLAQKLKGVAREVIMVGYTVAGEFASGWDLADGEAEGWDTERALHYLHTHAGDPWHIASGKMPEPAAEPEAMPDAGGDAGQPPAPPAPPAPANDNEPPRLPLDASVNPFGWPHLTDKGQPLNTHENLAYMLGEYGITTRYNEVRKLTEVRVPTRTYSADNEANCVLSEITSLSARNRMPMGMLADYIKLLADRQAYNPVKDWILSKPWDGKSRIADICNTVTVTGDRALTDKLIFRWLISCVAAVFMPSGFESHGVLVFTGSQGQGKTKWIKRLVCPELHDVVLVGAVLDPAQKDTVTNAISHWLAELGELDATFRKADIARLKSFITLATDKVRRPYDRIESAYQRRTVFFASVNEDKYLVDDTGNRRWWTVVVQAIDYLHTIDVQQLWAELLTLWRAGEQHWLTTDEFNGLNKLNAEHESVDPVRELILAAFDWSSLQGMGGREMTATQVLLALGFDKPTKAQATHCSKVLKELTGGEPKARNNGRFFKLPPAIRIKEPAGGFDHNDESRPF